MNKNEYRRAFIMLRPAVPGWSGHVRLERRTMTGSMYFVVSPAQRDASLYAALVGQRGGEYYAADLGALRLDSRGQATLAYAFDPRMIGGLPLDAYTLIAVAQADAGDCRIVLTGNVDGAYPMDITAVREAVCGLYRPELPAADLPGPGEDADVVAAMADATEEDPSAAPDSTASETRRDPVDGKAGGVLGETSDGAPGKTTESALSANTGSGQESAADSGASDVPPQATRIYTRMRAVQFTGQAVSSGREDGDRKDDSGDSQRDSVRSGDSGGDLSGNSKNDSRDRLDAGASDAARQPDPGSAPIRWRAIASGNQATPCAAPLEDGYTYVRVPLPSACGYGYSLIGVRADDDRVESVRVALPGAYAAQPPEGLEGSVWLGPSDGDGDGFWVFTVRCGER